MTDEKARVLQMIQDGKITVDEGMALLDALNESDGYQKDSTSLNLSDRFLKVRVDNSQSKVNVNIPLKLIKVTSKLVTMGMKYIPDDARREMENKGIDITKIDFEELVDLIDQGLVDGKLVDVDTEDPRHGRTKVEVYVE